MPVVPSWFIILPFIIGIIPLTLLVWLLFTKNKDIMIPQFLFVLPLTMFSIPMMFLILYLIGSVTIPFLIIPLLTGIVPVFFLMIQIQQTRQYAPEGEVFKKARLLRHKGKFGDVIMVCEGNDIAKFGCLETDPKTGKIVYHTKNYGIKINPSEYPNIPCMKTVDGVRLVIVSPLQITPANAESALVVQELLTRVREKHSEFDYLSDLQLATLLVTQGQDLEEDAHLYLNESEPDISEDSIIGKIRKIQSEENCELEVYPAHRFILFRKFQEVVNCPYVGPFLKDFELTVKSLTLEGADKSKEAKILLYACFLCAIMIFGVISFVIIKRMT
jgi:hypothetical protein